MRRLARFHSIHVRFAVGSRFARHSHRDIYIRHSQPARRPPATLKMTVAKGGTGRLGSVNRRRVRPRSPKPIPIPPFRPLIPEPPTKPTNEPTYLRRPHQPANSVHLPRLRTLPDPPGVYNSHPERVPSAQAQCKCQHYRKCSIADPWPAPWRSARSQILFFFAASAGALG